MVKLFVGNLSPEVTADKLRELFSQYGTVAECDVIKNYAFVHINNEKDAERAVKKLDNHVLEGRPLHIEQSTSRLRKAPGMSSVCYRCGADDHKTPSCPVDNADMARRMKANNGKLSPSMLINGNKRGPPRDQPYSYPVKRENLDTGGHYGPPGPSGPGPNQGYPGAAPNGYLGPTGPRGPDPSQSYFTQQPQGYCPPMGVAPQPQRPMAPQGYQGYPQVSQPPQQMAPPQQPQGAPPQPTTIVAPQPAPAVNPAPSLAEYYSTASAKMNDPVIPPPTDRYAG